MSIMSDSKAQQEPSIEEILSSIRQIINEDATDDAAGGAMTATGDDDVLDLADILPAKEEPAIVAPVMDEPMKSDDVDALFDAPAPPPPPAVAAPELVVAPAPVVAKAAPAEDSLLSESALNAAMGSLTKLAQAEVMIDHKHAAGIGSVTLEDVVKEMLRPMMKSWLDENLPPLVERLVQKEIQKLSSRL